MKNRPSRETGADKFSGGDQRNRCAFIVPKRDDIYEARLLGFAEGWAARQAEIDRANADADRFYRAAYNPPPKVTLGPSYAERERVRHAVMYGGA